MRFIRGGRRRIACSSEPDHGPQTTDHIPHQMYFFFRRDIIYHEVTKVTKSYSKSLLLAALRVSLVYISKLFVVHKRHERPSKMVLSYAHDICKYFHVTPLRGSGALVFLSLPNLNLCDLISMQLSFFFFVPFVVLCEPRTAGPCGPNRKAMPRY